MPPYSALDPAPLAFIVIPLLLAGVLVWMTVHATRQAGTPAGARRSGLRVGLAAGTWMALAWAAAASGVLRQWEYTPPPFVLLAASTLTLAAILAFGPVGTRLAAAVPLWVLVLVQAFRLPLELAMHGMYERGIMPVQLSYSGRNFDIATGATAIVVALLLRTGAGGRALAVSWNLLGLALLVNVVTVAILATPRFKYFGEEHLNTWVTYPPFVWLPAVMVLAAFAGHLLVFRALARGAAAGHGRALPPMPPQV